MLTSWKKSYDQPTQHIKKQRHYFANKGPSSQGYGFSSIHVWMWELDYKESWVSKNWCFWTVVWEKTLESPLDCKEIQPVHSEGDQSWEFIGRTDLKLKLQYFSHLMQRADSFEKPLMLGTIARVFSNTTVQKHQFFGTQPSSQSNSHIHTWPLEKP